MTTSVDRAAEPPRRSVPAEYFDGRSASARPVRLHVDDGLLHVVGDDGATWRRVPLGQVRWPERTRHAARIAELPDGGTLQARDPSAWDAWQRAAGGRESPVVRAQQSWRGVAAVLVLLLAGGAAGYLRGLPWIAARAVALMPMRVDRALGEAALDALDPRWLRPSRTPAARQAEIRATFAAAVARETDREAPGHALRFAAGAPCSGAEGKAEPGCSVLGPNAFALPGGTIVVTDEMLALLAGRDDVLLGVLGHELGHLRERHGLRMLVQASLLGAFAGLVWGDFSALYAALPTLYGQSGWSRDFERAADRDAIALLRANRISPDVMVELFERLAAERRRRSAVAASAPGGEADARVATPDLGLASHPDDAERIRAFRDAARERS